MHLKHFNQQFSDEDDIAEEEDETQTKDRNPMSAEEMGKTDGAIAAVFEKDMNQKDVVIPIAQQTLQNGFFAEGKSKY